MRVRYHTILLIAVAAAKSTRFAMFKMARTGSTWLADMLLNEPAIGFFKHEAQGCHSSRREPPEVVTAQDGTFSTFYSILARPSCNMSCADGDGVAWDSRGFPEWADALDLVPGGTPKCLQETGIGFDIEPYHELWGGGTPLNFAGDDEGTFGHWSLLLRLPNVRAVVYARTNQVKHAISHLRVHRLVHNCGTHKVFAPNSTASQSKDDVAACYTSHKREIDAPVVVDADRLAHDAYHLGSKWNSLVHEVYLAHDKAPILLFYEALQHNARNTLKRFFADLGLSGPRATNVAAESTSVKISGEDLTTQIAGYAAIADRFRARHSCLSAMLEQKAPAVSPAVCLENGHRRKWASLHDY